MRAVCEAPDRRSSRKFEPGAPLSILSRQWPVSGECQKAADAGRHIAALGPVAMNDDTPRGHHPFKVRFFLICLVGGIALAIGGALTGALGLVIPGAVAALCSLPPIWVIATGRGNPWWMRSPLDPGPAEGSRTDSASRHRRMGASATATREQRLKFRLVLAGSVGFVLAGLALVAVGVVRHRPDVVFVGAVCCVFFGTCAWVALAALRGRI